MIDAGERAAMEETVRGAIADALATAGEGTDVDAVLTQLGWLAWSIHPSTVVGLVALAAIYFWRARYAPDGAQLSIGRKLSFISALFVIFASLNGA